MASVYDRISNRLSYKLICDGYGEKVVKPLGENGLRMRFELNDEPINPVYRYDVTFTGTLSFLGEDFDFIYGAESSGFRCAEMFVEIKTKDCDSGELAQILDGTKIRLSDGEWDLDKCMVSIPVVSSDAYECVSLKGDDELNMFAAAGDLIASKFYGYSPTFEYNVSARGQDGMDFDTQLFEKYPNKRCEYPGFGCEGEMAEPYYPESGTASQTLFISSDLRNLKRNATTFEEILSTGSVPYHNGYSPDVAGAFAAVADGWRLCWFHYGISNTPASASTLNWVGRWRWCRETMLVPTGTPMPADWVFIATIGADDKYARAPFMVPRLRKYEPTKTFIDFPGSVTVFFNYSNYIIGETTNIVEVENPYNPDQGDDNIYGITELKNGKKLNNIIAQAVAHVCPELAVKSDFFQINPDTPDSDNYVTGEESTVNEIIIYQKTDVKRPWATNPATVGIYTPNELLQWLWDEFQVKYTISGSDFRLEHISSPVFRKPATVDITVPPYNKMNTKKRRYRYDTAGLVAKETFAFAEARKQVSFLPDDDFAGVPITYDGDCVNRKEGESILERKLGRITNDIIFILLNSGGSETFVTDNETSNSYRVNTETDKGVINNDGFAMVSTKLDSGTYYIRTKDSILNTVNIFNNVMGWAFLHDMFYRHERNAQEGTLNGASVTFASTKYIKKQTPVSYANCCIIGYDPHEKVTGDFGDGVLLSAEWAPQTDVLELVLRYQLT